jgi:SPP1 gp7 family putative phage head morphogenesis protein
MQKFDRKAKRQNWTLARRAESSYNSRLRAVAKQVGALVRGFDPDSIIKSPDQVMAALRQYSALLQPWARSVANYMLADVARRDLKMWKANSHAISSSIRSELLNAPTGSAYAMLMEEQVDLITSLPLDASQRIHALVQEAMITGQRSNTIKAEIMRTQQVSESKARLIARTEVARSAATFTQARAEFAGSEGYIWRTSEDGDVRPLHQEMNGKYVAWKNPPKLEPSLAPYHAGCGPNCRCFAEPVLPDL